MKTSSGWWRKPKSNRIRAYFMGNNAFLSLLDLLRDRVRLAGVELCHELPDDATICGVHRECERNGWSVLVESESFDEVPEGERIPGSKPIEPLFQFKW